MPWVRSPKKPDFRMRTGKDSPLLMSRGWLEVTSMEAMSIAVTRGVGRLVRDSLRVSMAAMLSEAPARVSSQPARPGGRRHGHPRSCAPRADQGYAPAAVRLQIGNVKMQAH